MNIKVSLFNSKTDDLAIVIDLLRASTTITVAFNTFKKVIPVNNQELAFEIKDKYDAVLAGELNLKNIEGYDLTNSPSTVNDFKGDVLVLQTTNGTKVLENIKTRNENVTVLVGTAINAHAVAKKALEMSNDEIELVMAGRRENFNIEDAVGAGIIINEIISIAKEENIEIELDESALASQIVAGDINQSKQLIGDSWGATKLTKLGFKKDVEVCQLINQIDEVPIYENGIITKL